MTRSRTVRDRWVMDQLRADEYSQAASAVTEAQEPQQTPLRRPSLRCGGREARGLSRVPALAAYGAGGSTVIASASPCPVRGGRGLTRSAWKGSDAEHVDLAVATRAAVADSLPRLALRRRASLGETGRRRRRGDSGEVEFRAEDRPAALSVEPGRVSPA